MRLEIVDTPIAPRDMAAHYKAARDRLLNAKPKPVTVETNPLPLNTGMIGWSFGFMNFVGATISLDFQQVTIRQIIQVTADFFGLTVHDLQSNTRQAHVCHARQIVMYLAREMTTKSLPAIGRQLGDRDHTTVMHGHRKIQSRLPVDDLLRKDVDTIRRMVKGIE
jgi:hypothetical protein